MSGAELLNALGGRLSGRQLRYRLDTLIDEGRVEPPGEVFLLDAPQRQRLRSMGLTSTTSAPAGTYARQILERLIVDLSWASSQLEGNTYTLLDTRRLIEQGQQAEGRDLRETQMILNHKRAIEFLVEDVGERATGGQHPIDPRQPPSADLHRRPA